MCAPAFSTEFPICAFYSAQHHFVPVSSLASNMFTGTSSSSSSESGDNMALRDPRATDSEMIEYACSYLEIGTAADWSSTSSAIVVVLAGADSTRAFSIHESVLCATSEFFNSAIQNEWTQAPPRVIELIEKDVAMFQVYVTWLYNRKLAIFPENAIDQTYEETWKLLTKSYLLGEELLDAKFKNTVVDAMLATTCAGELDGGGCCPSQFAIKTLYDGTTTGYKARQLFAEIWAHQTPLSELANGKHGFPYEFLYDVAEVLFNQRSNSLRFSFQYRNNPCRYHEHDQGSRDYCSSS